MKRILIAALLLTMLLPVGCGGQKYAVDYIGKKDVFLDAKERYSAGEQVQLKTYAVMDASPKVTVDGERLSPEVVDYTYLVYTFTMPEHDVKVDYVLGGSDMTAQTYRITYEGDTELLTDPIERAYAGETVTVKLGSAPDVSIDVYVDGRTVLQADGPDEGLLYFTFEMPTHDAVVTVTSKNISEEP